MPDNHDSAYLLCHNFIIPLKPQSTHTIDLEMTRHGSTHLAKNRGRHAQCRPRFFFRRTASPARSRSRTRDTPAPRRDRALPPASRRAAHSRVPTSPTPLLRPRRLCRLGARAFSAATVRVDDKLPLLTPSPSLRNTAAALLAYKRSNAVTSPVTSQAHRAASLRQLNHSSRAQLTHETKLQQLILFLELFRAKVRWQAAPPTINSTNKGQNTPRP